MVRVSVEVRNGAPPFEVAVQAESIRQALKLTGARYPEGEVQVKFPIDPEGFFVTDPATCRAADFEQPDMAAA